MALFVSGGANDWSATCGVTSCPPTSRRSATCCNDAGPIFHLSLDLKHVDVGPAVIEQVRAEAPELLPRLWLCAADIDVLAELRAMDDEVRLVNSTRLARMKEGPERRAATLAARRIDAVNLHHSDWTGGLTTLFHRFERVCFAWDLQFEHLIRPVVRMGIDGIFSDHVDVMVEAIDAECGSR